MTTPVIDPMDMDDPFSDPATGSGLDPFKGLLVIIKPGTCQKKTSKKGNGLVDTVTCEIIAVTGSDPGFTATTTIYSNSLVPQLMGRTGKLVIGNLNKKDFGRGEGWDLTPATPEQRQAGKKVLADIKAREEAKEKSEDPFA
jgi:hypothetical protein